MSRILTITNFGDFQFIEQTRERNQIRHKPSNTFVSTDNELDIYVRLAKMAFMCNGSTEDALRTAYERRGGNYA